MLAPRRNCCRPPAPPRFPDVTIRSGCHWPRNFSLCGCAINISARRPITLTAQRSGQKVSSSGSSSVVQKARPFSKIRKIQGISGIIGLSVKAPKFPEIIKSRIKKWPRQADPPKSLQGSTCWLVLRMLFAPSHPCSGGARSGANAATSRRQVHAIARNTCHRKAVIRVLDQFCNCMSGPAHVSAAAQRWQR